jgi:protein-tyrosine-phosphatase
MIVHFVCIGNTYRSRLAEAWFNVLGVPGWRAVSSGVRAARNLSGPIDRYTAGVLRENGLAGKEWWTQTTKEGLVESDIVVFMHQECLDLCREYLKFVPKQYLVWDIVDMDELPKTEDSVEPELRIARKTSEAIRKRVDVLAAPLRKSGRNHQVST